MSKTSTLIFNSTSNFAKCFMNIYYKFDGGWSPIKLFCPPLAIKFASNSIAGQNIFFTISIVGHPPTHRWCSAGLHFKLGANWVSNVREDVSLVTNLEEDGAPERVGVGNALNHSLSTCWQFKMKKMVVMHTTNTSKNMGTKISAW